MEEVIKDLVNEAFSVDALTEELREQTMRYSNCLLMYVYLLCRLGNHIETEVNKKYVMKEKDG